MFTSYDNQPSSSRQPSSQPSTSTHSPSYLSNLSHTAPNHLDISSSSGIEPDAELDNDELEAEAVFRDMSWNEIMDDLNARFLLNLPKEELGLVRVYWQAEQAHWFYEDYLRPLNPSLPSLSQRQFTHLILQSSPIYTSDEFRRSLLSNSAEGIGTESGKPLINKKGDIEYDNVWEEYCFYKRMVPCCGGILINTEGDKCLMVRGWKSNAGWSFPRGKINSEESEVSCAIREVEEETGFDLTNRINPKEFVQTQISAQTITMFIVGGIDEGTVFETQTRKEIGAIEWVRLVDLPTWTNKKGPRNKNNNRRFYNVTPFVTPLKKWLTKHGFDPNAKPRKAKPANSPAYRPLQPYQFDSPSSSSSPIPQHNISTDPSALDNLFSRFIHKQEEDLASPSLQPKALSSGPTGLERLFGNLDVRDDRKLNNRARSRDQTEEEKDEDDALAILLGGIGRKTPAHLPSHARMTSEPNLDGREGKLLGILNAKSPSLANPLTALSSPTQSTTKPHQSHLLSVLTTNPPIPQSTKPLSLPTSPRPPSPSPDISQLHRITKQQALLDTLDFGDTFPSAPVVIRRGSEEFDNSSRGKFDNSSRVRQIASPGQPPPYSVAAAVRPFESGPSTIQGTDHQRSLLNTLFGGATGNNGQSGQSYQPVPAVYNQMHGRQQSNQGAMGQMVLPINPGYTNPPYPASQGQGYRPPQTTFAPPPLPPQPPQPSITHNIQNIPQGYLGQGYQPGPPAHYPSTSGHYYNIPAQPQSQQPPYGNLPPTQYNSTQPIQSRPPQSYQQHPSQQTQPYIPKPYTQTTAHALPLQPYPHNQFNQQPANTQNPAPGQNQQNYIQAHNPTLINANAGKVGSGAHNGREGREQGVYHPVPRPPAGSALAIINQR